MIPTWLHLLSIASLALAGLCALAIAVDVARHPQHMAIMNVVWPVTALFGSVVWLWLYFRYGRLATRAKAEAAMGRDEEMPSKRLTPFWAKVAKGASPEFWFVMQLAMLCGFATAYPVNWWLIRSGIKEAM